jgi:hypothetical protein
MRRAVRGLAIAVAAALGLCPGATPLRAEPEEVTPGAPALVTLDALPLGVPLDALAPGARARAEGVLGRVTFAHRVTGLGFPSREPVFRFLLEHPDLAASVARALRLGEYRVTARGDAYDGDDRRGARGVIEVLHGGPEHRLFHLDGAYESRRLPTLAGRLLVLLEFRHQEDGQGGSRVEASLTGHLALDTPLVGTLAQVVGVLARPAVERAVERKVRRFFRTVARVSRWAHDHPDLLWSALEGHPEVAPGPALARFRDVLLTGRPPAWAGRAYSLWPDGAPGLDPGAREPATGR